MNQAPAVIVKKGGFFAAVANGLFGTLIVCILVGGGLAFYGLSIVDRRAVSFARDLAAEGAGWRDALMRIPIVGDALNDRRAADYRESLEVTARLAGDGGGRRGSRVVVELANRGAETVSFLSARLVVSDAAGAPVHESALIAATPITLDDDMPGPILPGSTRRIMRYVPDGAAVRVEIEVTDLRVFNPSVFRPEPETSGPDAARAPAEQNIH